MVGVDAGDAGLALSPHFDDAVLGAWSVLAREWRLAVVNLSAGMPEEGVLGRWDRIAGAEDSCRPPAV